ncbi:MAG: hypothetical protein A2927_00155 [Candidatus Komeilibacteria bacterium RIFCSPLOWO2_01_FULL_45_10]|uniref:Glycosyltransferase 2-like domain-containing protein n=1 Tax=Candidatus Komeilibacteria bacterium RIFCSPLOWO2_01_FULL_45_10 TaxID=1798550 RepID=A0A1G2BKJ1_9BACT|nr:MAG: hypothetical protein A2927_00155 [Candidatus Komeilibacteria bacterium RIFCSPLOWO2_01_FULL_45_10]
MTSHEEKMKKVAIIIVCYNGLKYLPKLLGSIFTFQPETVQQEIIVIDNASMDNSVPWLKQNYPALKIFGQSKNLGFAQGNNLGLKYAITNDFDYAMLLNQDTIIEDGYLDKLVAKAESNPAMAAVQPKILLYPLTDLINSVGNVIHYLGFGYTFGHKSANRESRIKNHEINYCSGAACLLKLAVLKKVGLFDEKLFMYHEDLDLGWRFLLAGYQNVIELSAVVYHQYEFSRSIKKYYFLERNRLIVIFQNYKLLTLLLILPALILMEIGLFIFSFFNGWWPKKLKVYLYFLNPQNWLKIIKTRSQIQQSRKKGDRAVVAKFSGLILHQEISNQLMEKIANPLFNAYWQVVKKLIVW